MDFENSFALKFSAKSSNEGFARTAVAMFLLQYDPLSSTLNDIKTAVSEAVTNSVIHGYENKEGDIYLSCGVKEGMVYIEIADRGKGIEDIKQAMEPLFTTKPDEERSGLGFTVMESFMDKLKVKSVPGKGTTITMRKKLGALPCRVK